MLGNIILGLSSVALFMLGFVVLLSNRRKAINWYLAMMVFGGFGWVLTNLIVNVTASEVLALWLSRSTFLWVSALSYFFALFSFAFALQKPLRKWMVAVATVPLLVCVALSPTVYGIVSVTPYGRDLVTGPGYNFLLLTVVAYLVAGLWRLIASYRGSSAKLRMQYQYIFLGILLSFIPGLIFDGVLVALGNSDFAAFGPAVVTIFLAFTTVAIIRHRFFNIRLIVARSVAFTFLLVGIAVVYAAVLLGMSNFVFKSGRAFGIDSVIEIGLTLLLAFTFQPLRRFVERVTNNLFYREHYDSQEVINNFTKILVSELDLDRILKRSLQTLCESVHIQYAQIVVYNNDRVYRIDHFGPVPQRLMVAPELAKLNHPMIIADELEGGERKATLEEHSIRISMTLRTSEQFVGYLLIGDKLSGDIYSNQDVKLLEIIGKELAVAILNAKSYAQIQEFNLTLQARVDHATNRLRVANRHLKELDHAKDEFISMASHQLRTPLTTIKGYLSMMLEGDAGPITPAQKDFVDYAFGASERMVNLISDLLNVSRLSAGRFLIQTKPTDVVQMVKDEVRQLKSHATQKGIGLVFEEPPAPLPLVEIDENKTRQVVMNFIDNAIYYTKEGEVRVVLELTGENIRLEVRDSGIGVPDVAKKKLFSKFFRADNAQIVRPDGTGLGLYLAKRVVEDQGGTIIFNSVEGKGSTFGFELPLKPHPQPKPGAARHARKS